MDCVWTLDSLDMCAIPTFFAENRPRGARCLGESVRQEESVSAGYHTHGRSASSGDSSGRTGSSLYFFFGGAGAAFFGGAGAAPGGGGAGSESGTWLTIGGIERRYA